MKVYPHSILTALLVLLLGNAALAQGSVKGRVIDENGEALPSATVMVTSLKDSVLAGFALTDGDGRFVIRDVQAGAYKLQSNYLQYETLNKEFELTEKQALDLGDLTLREKGTTLDNVEITDELIPIRIKGDTVEYTARAFETRPNASVEELLKRLPGMEVDQDGNIKAQGETVTKILVDGKEFFGNDPKVASKNLPAEAVDKVQVFDKMSEIAEFTGIDDGERSRTINLTLKEDYKTGYFGNVMGGYGTKDRFQAKANLNRFTEASQLSLLGMANNVNDQAFSVEDYITFMGGLNRVMGSGGRGGRGGGGGGSNLGILSGAGQIGNGINTAAAGGLNFNRDFGTKTTVQSSYFYNFLQNDLSQLTLREYIQSDTADTPVFNTTDSTVSQNRNHNHRASLRLTHRLDSLSEILLTGSGRYNTTFGDALSFSQSFSGVELINGSYRNQASDGALGDLDSRLQFRRKFAKRGRALVVEGTFAYNDNRQDLFIDAVNSVEPDSLGFVTDTILQNQFSDQTRMDIGGKASYTEPIGKRTSLEFNYSHQESFFDRQKDFFNLGEGGVSNLDSLLSNRYDGVWRYDQGGINLRFNKKTSNLTLGLNLQRSALNGVAGLNDSTLNKTFVNLLPALRWNYSPKKGSRLRLNYTARVNAPSVEDLQPVVDNSNPLNLSVGNPDLDAETAHNLRLHYFYFDMFSFTGFFAGINATYTANKISQSITVDSLLRQVTMPVNVDNDFRVNLNANFNTPIRKLGVKLSVSPNVTYNRAITLINDVQNPTNRLTTGGELTLENRKKDWLDAVAGLRMSHNITTYDIDADRNQSYLNTTWFGDLTATFLKNTRLNTNFQYTVYSGGTVAQNLTVPLWKASISKTFLGNERAEIKASVYDILNMNRGIDRSTNINYLEETRSNALGRYYMLSFTWKIMSLGKK